VKDIGLPSSIWLGHRQRKLGDVVPNPTGNDIEVILVSDREEKILQKRQTQIKIEMKKDHAQHPESEEEKFELLNNRQIHATLITPRPEVPQKKMTAVR